MIRKNRFIKKLLIFLGTFFVILGGIGIFLPILPTTPFLLVAALCYANSSEKFYNWLLNNKLLGVYIKNYIEKKGIPLKVKVTSILILWLTILISVSIASSDIIKIILILIAVAVSIHIILLPTFKSN